MLMAPVLMKDDQPIEIHTPDIDYDRKHEPIERSGK
jgi:hypothetical protein